MECTGRTGSMGVGRRLDAPLHRRQRTQMEHNFHIGHGASDRHRIGEIPLDNLRGRADRIQVTPQARAEIIEYTYLTSRSHQRLGQMRPNEAPTACH